MGYNKDFESINNILKDAFLVQLKLDNNNLKVIDNGYSDVPIKLSFEGETADSFPLKDVVTNVYNSFVTVKLPYCELEFKLTKYNERIVLKTLSFFQQPGDIVDALTGLKVYIQHGGSIPSMEIKYSIASDKKYFYKIVIKGTGEFIIKRVYQDDNLDLVEDDNLSDDEKLDILNNLKCLTILVEYYSIAYPDATAILSYAKGNSKN